MKPKVVNVSINQLVACVNTLQALFIKACSPKKKDSATTAAATAPKPSKPQGHKGAVPGSATPPWTKRPYHPLPPKPGVSAGTLPPTVGLPPTPPLAPTPAYRRQPPHLYSNLGQVGINRPIGVKTRRQEEGWV